MQMNHEERHDAYAAIKLKDFRLFLSFRFFLTVAVQMQSVIVGWQVYELTKDPLSLGLTGLAEAIPFMAVALYSGHVADRYNRKSVILGFQLLFLAGTLGLLAFTFNKTTIYNAVGILPVCLVVAVSGISRAFIYPSTIALMGQIVPRSLYANSSTWNSINWHVAAITGPAIGGLIYGFLGDKITYMCIIVLVLVSVFLLSGVKKPELPAVTETESLFSRIASGVRFVFRNQILFGSMSLDMLAVLFGGMVSMLPVFAVEILMIGPQGLGFLRAAPMAGAVIMSVFLAYRPPLRYAGKLLLSSVAGFGLSIILFALSDNFYLSLALLAVSGMFDNISVVIRATAVQMLTPDEMRGRVASVNSIFIGSSNELGSFESGLAAKIMGLVPSVIFGGGMTLLSVSAMAWKLKELRSLNLLEKMRKVFA